MKSLLLRPRPETGVLIDTIEHADEGLIGNCLIHESLMSMYRVWSG